MRSLLRGITSVCAVMKGMPVGMRRNSALTANQSASPPTMAASEIARWRAPIRLGGTSIVTGEEGCSSQQQAGLALGVSEFPCVSSTTPSSGRGFWRICLRRGDAGRVG